MILTAQTHANVTRLVSGSVLMLKLHTIVSVATTLAMAYALFTLGGLGILPSAGIYLFGHAVCSELKR